MVPCPAPALSTTITVLCTARTKPKGCLLPSAGLRFLALPGLPRYLGTSVWCLLARWPAGPTLSTESADMQVLDEGIRDGGS